MSCVMNETGTTGQTSVFIQMAFFLSAPMQGGGIHLRAKKIILFYNDDLQNRQQAV